MSQNLQNSIVKIIKTSWEFYTFGYIENIHVIDRIAETPTVYTVAKLSCYDKIPDGENVDNWVTINDPRTRKILYSKTPEEYTERSYYSYLIKLK